MSKRILEVNEETVVDKVTGEVMNSKIQMNSITKETEPSYIKLYLDDMKNLNGLSGFEYDILLELIKLSSYENIFNTSKYYREIICKNLNVKDQTVKNAISCLRKKSIIFTVSSGVARLNPYLFGKGTWKDIKALRLTVEYTQDGRSFSMEEVREEDEDNAQPTD